MSAKLATLIAICFLAAAAVEGGRVLKIEKTASNSAWIDIFPTQNYTFDYLRFVQYWPQTFCIDNPRSYPAYNCTIPKNVTSFIIHGIWPTINHTERLQWCDYAQPYREDILQAINPQLNKYWTNLWPQSQANANNWRVHEWVKHGTCLTANPDLKAQYTYFSTGLQLRERTNVQENLAKNGIVPSDTTSYTYDQLANALKKELGAFPIIMCATDPKRENRMTAFQVMFCMHTDLKFFDCPLWAAGWYVCDRKKPIYLPVKKH